MIMKSFKYSKEVYIAVLAIVGISIYLILRFALKVPVHSANGPLWITLVLGGIPLVLDLLKNTPR